MNRCTTLAVIVTLAVVGLASWPAVGAPPGRAESGSVGAITGGTVNINTADAKELMKLEGVGRKVAEKIIEYREQHGLFQKPEEIRKVQGIGSGLWERNRARIVVK